MSIPQVIDADSYAFLEKTRGKILNGEEIPAAELNQALMLITNAARESRKIEVVKRASPGRVAVPKASLSNLLDM